MNVLIISDCKIGASVCDAFWKKLIYESIDPYVADKKNKMTFLHLQNSPVPVAQKQCNMHFNQDFDAIELVEYNNDGFLGAFEKACESRQYDIAIIAARSSHDEAESACISLNEDTYRCLVSAIDIISDDVFSWLSTDNIVDVHVYMKTDNSSACEMSTLNGKIDILYSDLFCRYTERIGALSSISKPNAKSDELFGICVSTLLNARSELRLKQA